jgi:hypothetical protein
VHRWRYGGSGDLRGVRHLNAHGDGTTASDRDELIAVAVITAVGFIVRLVALNQPMRYDESITWAFFSARSWGTIVSWYPFPNNHVLFSLLAKATAQLSPFQPWAFRLPAFVAGVAILPLVWAVGRRLTDRRTALIGTALAVGSTPLVLYSVNGRGHTIVVALSLVLILVADRLRARPSWWPGWVAFSVVSALGLYTVPVMVYPIGAVSLWIALESLRGWRTDRRRALRTIVTLGAAGVASLALAYALYLPIIRTAGVGAITGNKLAQPISWSFFVSLLPKFAYEIGTTWTAPLPWWCVPLVFGLALYGLRPTVPSSRASLATATLLWCVGLFLLSHRQPFARFWLFMLPLVLLCVARGIVRVLDRWPSSRRLAPATWAYAIALALAVVALGTRAAEVTDDTGTYREARAVTAVLAAQLRAGDRVLAPIPNNAPLLYYFDEKKLDVGLLDTPPAATRRAFLVLNPQRGQTLEWAVKKGMIDPAFFTEPVLLLKAPDAELWRTERR